MSNAFADFLFFVIGPLLALSVPVAAVVGAIRAKRRKASTLGIVFSALAVGFITAVIAAVVGWVGLMGIWGMSI